MPYEEQYMQNVEFDEPGTIEVPAMDYGEQGKLSQINQYLTKHRNSKKTVKELLAIETGCTLDKKFNYIIDATGKHITPGTLLSAFGVGSTGHVRCGVCAKPIHLDDIFSHLQSSRLSGHSMNTGDTIKLFLMEFLSWDYSGSTGFRYRGDPIEFKK